MTHRPADHADSAPPADAAPGVDSVRLAAATRRNALALLPSLPVLALVVLAIAGPPPLAPLALGAAGWIAALVLRQPVILLVSRLTTPERTATIVGWLSGPAEELVRLAVVLVVIRSTADAVWAGAGWAAAEIVLVAVNTFAVAALLGRDDPKALDARELLAVQGMTKPQHPLWGFVERLSASALHIGFSLLLVSSPWLVLVTLPAHSVVNMVAVRLGRSSLAATELFLAVAGAAAVVAGVLLAVR